MAKRPPVKPPVHVMVDLETLGTSSHAAILSIGAAAFDPWGKGVLDTFVMGVTLDSALKYGRVDASTIEWWFSPSRADARLRLATHAQEDLDNVLFGFSEWVRRVADGAQVNLWGNGATFDNVILSNAYAAVGYDRPWSYSGDRCFRTLKNTSTVKAPKFVGVAHDPLDDTVNQITWLQAIVKRQDLRVL